MRYSNENRRLDPIPVELELPQAQLSPLPSLAIHSLPRRALEIWGGLDELNNTIKQSGYSGKFIELAQTRATSTSQFRTHQGLLGTIETQRFLAVTPAGLKMIERSVDFTPTESGNLSIESVRHTGFSNPTLLSCLRLAAKFDLCSLRESVESILKSA